MSGVPPHSFHDTDAMRTAMPAARQFAIVLALALAGVLAALALDTEALRAAYRRVVPDAPEERFTGWLQLIESSRRRPAAEQLARINDFINGRIRFVDDIDLWGQSDYWATPMETLARGAGDCEDFAIAKYFTLLQVGIPVERLRLTYVRARLNAPGGPVFQAHMVLAYYAKPDAEPVILDNLDPSIQPASRRTDLLPVFNFNSERIYQTGAGNTRSAGVGQLSRWADALERIRIEGFD